jgi:hypothetical protein
MSSKKDEEQKRSTIWPTGAADESKETKAIDLPARHVIKNVRAHELVSTEELQDGTKVPIQLLPVNRYGQCPHSFGRTTDHIPLHLNPESSFYKAKIFETSRQGHVANTTPNHE